MNARFQLGKAQAKFGRAIRAHALGCDGVTDGAVFIFKKFQSIPDNSKSFGKISKKFQKFSKKFEKIPEVSKEFQKIPNLDYHCSNGAVYLAVIAAAVAAAIYYLCRHN